MRPRINVQSLFCPRSVIAPALIAATLALAACGGSSNNATGTAAPSSSTSAAAATATEMTGVATSQATGESTAAPTQAAPTPTTAPKPTKAATQAASSGGTSVPISPVSVLQQVADTWKNLKSYKMTMTIYDSTTNAVTGSATLETTLPDKTHWVITDNSQSTGNGQPIELITIGNTSYLKLGDTWTQTSSAIPTALPPITGTDILNDISTPAATPDLVTKKGTDTVNGVSCNVYEVKVGSNTSTFWVGQQDHFLYKISAESDGTRTEILISDFNKDFNIQPPI